MIVSLIGIPGSHLEEIGKIVSEKTGIPCRSTDAILEKENGKSAALLYEEKGEVDFRRMERKVLVSLLDEFEGKDLILVCGDGLPTSVYEANQIKKKTLPVWVKKSVKAIAADESVVSLPPYRGDRKKFVDACVNRYTAYQELNGRIVENPSDEGCAAWISSFLLSCSC